MKHEEYEELKKDLKRGNIFLLIILIIVAAGLVILKYYGKI